MAETLTPSSYIVLGLTEQLEPATPYDLKRVAGLAATNFWSIPQTQVYAETARLAEAGYLSEDREDSGRRRRFYGLTEKGKKALKDWRSEPSDDIYQLHDVGLLKLYLGADPAPLAARQVEAHKRKLAEFEAQLKISKEAGAARQVMLAIEAGVGHEREYVRFWKRLLE
jgi:PadR family transcriptional regulator AphA